MLRGHSSLCRSLGACTRPDYLLRSIVNCDAAIAALEQFSDSKYKAALVEMCDKVLNRMK